MSNPQETCVSTQDTFRLIEREEPTSNSVSALVSRLNTCSINLEGSKNVDGTTQCAEEEGKKDDPPFPWLSKINDLCRSAVGSKNIKTLENLLTVYLQKVTPSVNDCYQKPIRATKLKSCMNIHFVYFHFLYQDIKESVDNTMYLQKMTELMAMYLDLEIASSRRRKETTKKVVSRMASALNIYLDRSEDHILDALMRAKSIKNAEREVCCPILEKVLTSFQKRQMQDTLYVRYLLVFKLWKKIVSDTAMRKKINALAIEKLPSPANFADRYKRFNNVLPRVPTNKNITTFYMQAKIDVTKACQNFMKISKDPTLPVMPDKPLFFEGRSQSTFSGKGNSFDGGVSRNLMNEIWSSINEENTSNKKSNSNKKKGKNKKGDKKKEKSDSISETESTPDVPAKTPSWEATVEVRTDVVMINSSQPPPPGTEPPPPARVPPPPPPPTYQIKPQPPPALPKPLAPAPPLQVMAKPIATIVAMKKEVVLRDEPPACKKSISIVPNIVIKVEPEEEMASSPVEMVPSPVEMAPTTVKMSLSPAEPAKPCFEAPMETEAPVTHFVPATEMEQVYGECEVQLGDQDLPYIEEEVVEPCNPVGYAESPEAEFGKTAVADIFGASQAKGAVEVETRPEAGRKRPEKTRSKTVVVQDVKPPTDSYTVPLQHIKSERVDSPTFDPVPCIRAETVPRVRSERTPVTKPNGVVVVLRPEQVKASRHSVPKHDMIKVIQTEKLVASRDNHLGSLAVDCVPRKSQTLSSEGHVSASKTHPSSDAHTLSNKVRTSSEGHISSNKVRTSSSEGPSSSPKIRTSSSDGHSSSPKIRTSSNDGHSASPKIRTSSSDGHSTSPKIRTSSSDGHSHSSPTKIRTSSSDGHSTSSKIRTSSSEGHSSSPKMKTLSSETQTSSPKVWTPSSEAPKARTPSCDAPKARTLSSDAPKVRSSSSETHKTRTAPNEAHTLSPKVRNPTSDSHTLSAKIRTPSSEGRSTSSPKIKALSSESHNVLPKKQTSTGDDHALPKIRTSSSEQHKIRTSSSEEHKIRTSISENNLPSPKILYSSTEGKTSPTKILTSSTEVHKIRTSSSDRHTPSPKTRPSSSAHTSSPKHEKPRPPAVNPLPHLDQMPTLQAELPSPTKSEKRDKSERPHHANGTKPLPDVYYRCGPYIGEYGQVVHPQIANDLADLEVALIPTGDRVWPETAEKQAEKVVVSKQEMPPPKLHLPRVDTSRSPRSRSPRTPSPRAEVSMSSYRTEQTLSRADPPTAPFAAFATPKPPSPQKSLPFGLAVSPAGIADSLFAAPRIPEAEPELRYSLDPASQADLYFGQPLPTLDLGNCVDGLDFDSEPYPFCEDSLFGGYAFNEDYMFNMSELSHTCMVDPNLVEQRTTTTTNEEPFVYPTYTVDPMELRNARDAHSFLTNRPGWQNTAPDTMPMGALLAGVSDDDDSNGYAQYANSAGGGYPNGYGASEYLNTGAMLDPAVPAALGRTAKAPDACKLQEEDKAAAAASKTDSRKRLHAATRPHLQENSAVLNCSPLGGSKPTVARSGVRSKGRAAGLAKKETACMPAPPSPPSSSPGYHTHDVFFGDVLPNYSLCDNDLDIDLGALNQTDSDFIREKPRIDGGNKRPVTRSISKVTAMPLDASMPGASKRQRKIR